MPIIPTMHRVRSVFLAVPFALLAAAALADDPLRPALDYGHTDRKPQVLTASERPDQIRLGAYVLRGDVVSRREDAKLGDIETIFIDPRAALVSVVQLAPTRALVPWASLEFVPREKARFLVDLTPDDIANAPRPNELAGLDDLKPLLSRQAVGADGKALGRVADLIAMLGDGDIVAVVVEENAPALKPKEPRALSWSAVSGRAANGDLLLSITEPQFAQAPLLTSKAPRWAFPDVPPRGTTDADRAQPLENVIPKPQPRQP
jgi:hypothetical protein